MPARHRLAPLFAVAAALVAWTAEARLTVMHGFPDLTSVTLWVQADRAGPVDVELVPASGGEPRRASLVADAGNDFVAATRVPGLAPGTTYRYRIAAQGELREGLIATQPYWSRGAEAAAITIAIGSCAFLAPENPAWPGRDYGGDFQIFDAIAAKRPDLMLWLGDNLYLQPPDFLDPAAAAAHYRQVRQADALLRLWTATAHVAIWDDHDFGPNDSNGSYPLKGETLKLFQRYWPNPIFGLPGVPGAFGWVRYGDVDFFLLDDRYYRHPNNYPDVPEKSMFGAAQFEWLKQALISSKARLKIVAGGSQFWNRASRFEGLHQFPQEQRRLADWLVAQRIDGVIFLSGDRHFGELLRIERPGAYPLYEYTSSPLTSRAVASPARAERENPDVVAGTFRNQRQFGMIRVSGPAADRRVALEAYDSDGGLLWRHEIAVNELRFDRKAAVAGTGQAR